MLARRDERNLEPLPKARALGMGFAGRGSVNPDHLKSRTRTLGRPWRRREESAMLGEGSELRRGEGSGRKTKEGRREALRIPCIDGSHTPTPKPLQLTGGPPPLRELSSHGEHTGLLGGPYFMEQWKSSFSPTLLL